MAWPENVGRAQTVVVHAMSDDDARKLEDETNLREAGKALGDALYRLEKMHRKPPRVQAVIAAIKAYRVAQKYAPKRSVLERIVSR